MAPGTAAQASAGSRVSDGNAHRALPIRTHGAPPQERQLARSVTRRGPSSRHPVLVRTQPADTTPTPLTSDTCPRRESPGQHNVYTTFVRRSRCRGLRRVRAARLAGPRPVRASAAGPAGSPSGRRSARSRWAWPVGRLPPDGPGRDGPGAVGGHHRRIVPARPGPGHGGPHWRTCCAPTRRPQTRRTAGPGRRPPCGRLSWSRFSRTRTDQTAERCLTGTGPRGRTRTVPGQDRNTAVGSRELGNGPRSHR